MGKEGKSLRSCAEEMRWLWLGVEFAGPMTQIEACATRMLMQQPWVRLDVRKEV